MIHRLPFLFISCWVLLGRLSRGSIIGYAVEGGPGEVNGLYLCYPHLSSKCWSRHLSLYSSYKLINSSVRRTWHIADVNPLLAAVEHDKSDDNNDAVPIQIWRSIGPIHESVTNTTLRKIDSRCDASHPWILNAVRLLYAMAVVSLNDFGEVRGDLGGTDDLFHCEEVFELLREDMSVAPSLLWSIIQCERILLRNRYSSCYQEMQLLNENGSVESSENSTLTSLPSALRGMQLTPAPYLACIPSLSFVLGATDGCLRQSLRDKYLFDILAGDLDLVQVIRQARVSTTESLEAASVAVAQLLLYGKLLLSLPAAPIVWLCDSLEAGRRFFLSVCSFLRSNVSSLSFHQSQPIVFNLITEGRPFEASVHLFQATMRLMNTEVDPDVETLLTIVDQRSRLLTIPAAAISESSSLRAAVLLHYLYHQHRDNPIFISDMSSCLSHFLSLLLQVSAPVVLESSLSLWKDEVFNLRRIAHEILYDLNSTCAGNKCSLISPEFQAGMRGIFLLAYQGASMVNQIPFMADKTLPTLYHEIVLSTQEPTSYPQLSVSCSGKIRLGFLSAHWYRHSVGKLLVNLIVNLPSDDLEVVVIQFDPTKDQSQHDELTEFIKNKSDVEFIRLESTNSLDITLHLLRALKLNVVVYGDIQMNSFVAHIAMHRFADVNIAFWGIHIHCILFKLALTLLGHPFTSGYTCIDYFLSSIYFEGKVSRQNLFSEQIVFFDSLSFTSFPTFSYSSQPFGQSSLLKFLCRKGSFLSGTSGELCASDVLVKEVPNLRFYGCLQSLMKFHPEFDQVIVEILVKDPLAVIVILKNNGMRSWQRTFERRLLRSIQSFTVGAISERVFLLDQMSPEDYMAIVCSMSVNLDTFPFGGGVTLIDSLDCGVPFVTLPDHQTVHQIGAGIAQKLNLTDFISLNLSEYITKSIRLAESHNNSFTAHQALDILNAEVVLEWRTFLKRVTV